jgi:ABC-2 type transport system ATP-binding protein
MSVSSAERSTVPTGNAEIRVDELEKRFGDTHAVRGVSFSVFHGEIFGLLGPNGAGKTTTIKILLSLLRPSGGRATVAGFDVAEQGRALRAAIGWVPQEITLDPLLTGRENLLLQAGMQHLPSSSRRPRVAELLTLVELSDAADRIVRTYSGGMKKRLDLAMGLIHRPRVLFLDEPTLGLDVHTRHRLWEYIEAFRDMGTTILLTTHYLEEADALCDRIAVIDEGQIRDLGTPDELKRRHGRESIRLELGADGTDGDLGSEAFRDALAARPEVLGVHPQPAGFWLEVSSHAEAVPAVLAVADAAGVVLKSIICQRPSLDDVFLQLTGYSLRERTQGGRVA